MTLQPASAIVSRARLPQLGESGLRDYKYKQECDQTLLPIFSETGNKEKDNCWFICTLSATS